MIREKSCKGNGVAKGHGCGALVPVSLYGQSNRRYGLGISCKCYNNWLTSTPEGKEKLQKSILKATSPRVKAEQDLEKAFTEKKNRKGLTTLIKSVVNVFHEYVRLRDKGKRCIACGTEWKSDFQASHYYKAELYSTLKFHEDNVISGCMECNLRKEGNLSEYAVNLPKRIGIERFNELNKLADLEKKSTHKWDREELKEIRSNYNRKIKELKQ